MQGPADLTNETQWLFSLKVHETQVLEKKQLRNYFTLKMRLKRTIGEIRYAANIKELLRPCKGRTIPLSPYGASPNRVHDCITDFTS